MKMWTNTSTSMSSPADEDTAGRGFSKRVFRLPREDLRSKEDSLMTHACAELLNDRESSCHSFHSSCKRTSSIYHRSVTGALQSNLGKTRRGT
ncbi:hypothetical protein DPEC_G00273100 [Dallia pectoralis]|uniref:Uncharacterized protein n=1 Tax=Dallia pectoralis TaxID=75939 RepID=A0ACC2FPY8_DALPE|nr:hypothetical protein DPEC_G00273100 [Dallia pectoralis]